MTSLCANENISAIQHRVSHILMSLIDAFGGKKKKLGGNMVYDIRGKYQKNKSYVP